MKERKVSEKQEKTNLQWHLGYKVIISVNRADDSEVVEIHIPLQLINWILWKSTWTKKIEDS